MNAREIGTHKEDEVCEYLKKKGYEIEERNFRSRSGEIDIIARYRGGLVFVEVKYRSSQRSGAPEQAVDWKKRRRIIKTADYYRVKHHIYEDEPCRFDVIAVTEEGIRHYENAFDYYGQ